MNSGAGKLALGDGTTSRFVRFGWTGAPDIIGQLRDGRLLAVEVKRREGVVSQEQKDFLRMVHQANGLAFVARSVDDVFSALAAAMGPTPKATP